MLHPKLAIILRRGSLLASAVGAVTLSTIAAPAFAAENDRAFQDGCRRYVNKNFAEAIPKLQEYLAKNPEGARAPEAKFVLGSALSHQSRWAEAAQTFSDFLKDNKDPNDRPLAEYFLGEAYFHVSSYQQAIDAYNQFLAAAPAVVAPAPSKTRPAKKYLNGTRFVEVNEAPDDRPYAEVHLGDSQFQLARQEEAAAGSNSAQLYQAAATSFSKAISDAAPSTDSRTRDLIPYATYWMGQSRLHAGDYDASSQAFDAVITRYAKSPQFSDSMEGKAQSLIAKADALSRSEDTTSLKQSISATQDALKLLSDDSIPDTRARTDRAQAYSSLGRAQYALKDYSDAADAYVAYLQNLSPQANPKLVSDGRYLVFSSYLRAGLVDKAKAVMPDILQDPANNYAADASYSLARYSYDNKQWTDAIDEFRSFTQRFPKDERALSAYTAIADAAVNKKDTASAASAYHEALLFPPPAVGVDSSPLRLKLLTNQLWADEQTHQNQDLAAVRAQIQKEYPDTFIAKISALQDANPAYNAGRFSEALPAYQAYLTYITDHSKEAEVQNYLAYLKDQNAAGKSSRSDIDTVTYETAYAMMQLKQYPEAAARFNDLRKRLADEGGQADPKLKADALAGIGELYLKQNKMEDAAGVYTQLINENAYPELATTALYNRATAYSSSGNWDAAAKDYTDFIQKYPQHKYASDAAHWAAESYLQAGAQMAAQNNYSGATTAWNTVVTRFHDTPEAPKALLARAAAQVRQKHNAEAISVLTQLRTSYPHSPEMAPATITLAELQSAGNPKNHELFDEYRTSSYPDDPAYPPALRKEWMAHALYGAAAARFRSGNYAEAAPLYRQRLADYADYPGAGRDEAIYGAAESLFRQGKYSEALPLFKEETAKFSSLSFKGRFTDPSERDTVTLDAAYSALRSGDEHEALAELSNVGQLTDPYTLARIKLYKGEILLQQGSAKEAASNFYSEIYGPFPADNPLPAYAKRGPNYEDLAAETAYHLAQAYEVMGNWKAAATEYQYAANWRQDPGGWGIRARSRLAALRSSHTSEKFTD